MTFYEIMTEDQPFQETSFCDAELYDNIATKGLRPQHPGLLAEDRGLSPIMWAMMTQCWSENSKERPSASQIANHIDQLIDVEQKRSKVAGLHNVYNWR
ncbi:hypothetical protein SCHPADRAFT_906290 [Schizopora paradoxa]|uniref:Serine-threonine/tyrosine-protein kinase catalytic domain-containing protein n=1 Tax=Schizopora paradoxa TaxID=27342 RepID=A0A0H2RHR4_9AGAM|nr:hypothetical protein SCHPADRAFT_906290 [Schizopora paradoxa]